MMFRLCAALSLAAAVVTSAQTISFNSPLPWVSLRNDTVIVRAQVDTAALKGKEISLTLFTVEKGKATSVSTKKFKLTEPSGEFSFGKIRKTLVGGEAYLKIQWKISGTEEKGDIAPIGIADLAASSVVDTLKAVRADENAKASDIAANAMDKMAPCGTTSFACAWNKTKFFVVVKKSTAANFKVGLDGKCGKNAFLSYPDRFITASFGDSLVVGGIHFQRDIKDDAMVYTEQIWQNEITSEVVGDVVVISMPWFDTGIIPFEERSIGMAAFSASADGKSKSAIPAAAKFFIPATWGVVFLQK